MNNYKIPLPDVQYFLSLLTRYSLFAFACITVVLVLSSFFIKASLDHQQRMLHISAITFDQRLTLRELNETVNFLLRSASNPMSERLINQIRGDIKNNLNTLIDNQAQLELFYTKRDFIYHYWPFSLFYSNAQYDMIVQIRTSMGDITERINTLLEADYGAIATGFSFWDPSFLRTVRQGAHTLALQQLNTQVYDSAKSQHDALSRLHLYLFLFVIACIWVIWLLILRPLTSRTRFLFTEIKNNEQRLHYQANHDSLTKLLNRNALKKTFDSYKDKIHPKVAIIAIDVDNFKMINDSYGHSAGDTLLQHISSCIMSSATENELHFRSGGDEFLIFIAKCNSRDILESRLSALYALLEKPLSISNTHSSIISCLSIGIAYQNGDYQNVQELFAAADIALYTIKHRGGNNHAFYDDIENRKISQILQLEDELKSAVVNRQFVAHYQPIFDIQENKIIGFEALGRWRHPSKGILPPANWISIAERLGLLSSISLLVTENVLHDQIHLQKNNIQPISVTINLTEKLLASNDLYDLLDAYKEQYKDYHFKIGLEIHESIVLQRNFKQLSEKLAYLQQQGFKILIDDFGTGYATINHLLYLPFDYLKTDHTLLNNLQSSEKNRVVLQAMHSIATGLGKQLICEGVENQQILHIIENMGIRFAQGFHFGKPQSFENSMALISDKQQQPVVNDFI